MMINDFITKLLNYALDHGIGFQLTKLKKNMPSFAIQKHKFIIINVNWENSSESPFQIDHEIGHVLNEDDMNLYNSKVKNYRFAYEHNANRKALKILLPMYLYYIEYSVNNVYIILNQLCIPTNLADDVRKIAVNYIKNHLT